MNQLFPYWMLEPFSHYLKEVQELHRLMSMLRRGVSMVYDPDLLEASARQSRDQEAAEQEKLQESQSFAILAGDVLRQSYHPIHSKTVVFMWTLFETLINDFLVLWLMNVPKITQTDALRELNIKALKNGPDISDENQAWQLVTALERHFKKNGQHGIDKFEGMLKVFGLSGIVQERNRQDLMALWATRNAIVHKRGVADNQIVKACPWLQLRVGDLILVDTTSFTRYRLATTFYADALAQRALFVLGWILDQTAEDEWKVRPVEDTIP